MGIFSPIKKLIINYLSPFSIWDDAILRQLYLDAILRQPSKNPLLRNLRIGFWMLKMNFCFNHYEKILLIC